MSKYIDDLPPDEWDAPPTAVQDPPHGRDNRVTLDHESERLREAWIVGVRKIHSRHTGMSSRYYPPVVLDGGKCPMTKRNYKPAWPRLVSSAKQLGLDPVALVETLFSTWVSDRAPISPNIIFQQANVDRARRSESGTVKRIAAELRTEEAVYRSSVWSESQTTPDKTAAIRYVLFDVSRILSPLFRYCAAVMYGLDDVAHAWKTAATCQFRRHPAAYAAAWASIIPTELKAEAARLTA